jgi:hypothetical protein
MVQDTAVDTASLTDLNVNKYTQISYRPYVIFLTKQPTTHVECNPWKANCLSAIQKIIRWLRHSYIQDSHLVVCYDKKSSRTAPSWRGMLYYCSVRLQLICQLTWRNNQTRIVSQATTYYFWQIVGGRWFVNALKLKRFAIDEALHPAGTPNCGRLIKQIIVNDISDPDIMWRENRRLWTSGRDRKISLTWNRNRH